MPLKPEFDADAVGARPGRCRAGLTLVELLVVLALSILIMGATFMIYQTNSRFYYRQQAQLEQIQNLRSALYILSRDIRMAGDGLIVMGVTKAQAFVPRPTGSGGEWFSYPVSTSGAMAANPGLRAIYGLGNSNQPDTLTVFRTEVESSVSFGQLRTAFTSASSQLELSAPVPQYSVFPGDVLGLASGTGAVLVSADTASGAISAPTSAGQIRLGDRFKPGSSFPSGLSFPAGTYVYNLRDAYLTTYWVDTVNHNLMARYHHLGDLDYDDSESSIIVSPNIEDLQLQYVLNGQEPDSFVDTVSLETLEGNNWVRQIKVGLVGLSEYRERSNGSLRPVALFDHNPGAVADGRFRQVLTSNVHLRNY